MPAKRLSVGLKLVLAGTSYTVVKGSWGHHFLRSDAFGTNAQAFVALGISYDRHKLGELYYGLGIPVLDSSSWPCLQSDSLIKQDLPALQRLYNALVSLEELRALCHPRTP